MAANNRSNKQRQSIERAASWAATQSPQQSSNASQQSLTTTQTTKTPTRAVQVSASSPTPIPTTSASTSAKPSTPVGTIVSPQNCELSLVSYLTTSTHQHLHQPQLVTISSGMPTPRRRYTASATLFSSASDTNDAGLGDIEMDANNNTNASVDTDDSNASHANASSVAHLLKRFMPGQSHSIGSQHHQIHFSKNGQHGLHSHGQSHDGLYEDTKKSRSADDLNICQHTAINNPDGTNTNTHIIQGGKAVSEDAYQTSSNNSDQPSTTTHEKHSTQFTIDSKNQEYVTSGMIEQMLSSQSSLSDTVSRLLVENARLVAESNETLTNAIKALEKRQHDHASEITKEIKAVLHVVSANASSKDGSKNIEHDVLTKEMQAIKTTVAEITKSVETSIQAMMTSNANTVGEKMTTAFTETHAKLVSIETAISNITYASGASVSLTRPGSASTNDIGIDRPTKNLLLSINEKLIQLSKLCDHSQQSITSRIGTLEERIVRSQSSMQSDQADAHLRGTRLDKMMQDIKSDLADMCERVGKMSREQSSMVSSNTNMLQRILGSVEAIVDAQHGVPSIMASRSLNNSNSGSNLAQIDDASSGSSSSSFSTVSNPGVMQSLDQIRQTLMEESHSTSERMNQLLGIFGILQDAHVQLSNKLCSALDRDVQELTPVLSEPKKSVEDAQISGLASKVQAVDERVGDMAQSIKDLSERVQQLMEKQQDTIITSKSDQIQATSFVRNEKSFMDPSAMRLLESVHSTLVNYLPLDLERRLTAIEASMRDVHAPQPVSGITAATMPQQADARLLATWQQEIMSQNTSILSSLDGMQHSLSRLLEYVPTTASGGRGSGTNNSSTSAKDILRPVISLETDTEVKTLLKELKLLALQASTVSSIAPSQTTVKQLQFQRNDLKDQIQCLQDQKNTLLNEIKTLRAARSAHVSGLGFGMGIGLASAGSASTSTTTLPGSARPSVSKE